MKDFKEKQMIQRIIDSSLSGVQEDPWLAQRVLNIAHGKEKNMKKISGRIPFKCIAVLLMLVLLFGTSAFALTRPAVLKWLTGSAPASTQLEATAQQVMGESTADGITIRVTSVVYDGEQLAFSYEVENAQPTLPVMVAAQPTVRINGREHRLLHCTADLNAPQMVPSPHLDVLPVRRNPAVGGGLVRVDDVAGGEAVCEMTFIVYQPERQFVMLLSPDGMLANAAAYSGDERAEIEDSLRTLESFQNTILSAEAQRSAEQWLAEGCTVLQEGGMLDTLPASCHLKESAQITVRFTFEASLAFACDLTSSQDIPLEDATLHVARFRLSSLETSLALWLIPRENTEDAARDLAARYGAYTLVDACGEAVKYSEMDHMAAALPDVVQINGQWVCRYLSDMPGLLHFPESVGFTAGGEELIRFDLRIAE